MSKADNEVKVSPNCLYQQQQKTADDFWKFKKIKCQLIERSKTKQSPAPGQIATAVLFFALWKHNFLNTE